MRLNKLFPQILIGYVDNMGCVLTNNECNELTKYVSGLELEIALLTAANKWVSVSELPIIPEGRKSSMVWVLWHWDTYPEDLYPGLGQIWDDASKVMVDDGDFDKEVDYWQYILPTPPTGGENE
jgi:hypothetical protein